MRVALGLGSNLGDRLAHLQSAYVGLAEIGEIVAVSGLYRSDPVGGPNQPDFLNAVVVIDSDRSLREVLAECQGVEHAAERVRSERWGPRTLDVDILTAAAPPLDTPDLQVPHPRLIERRFALEPLAEVWPDSSTGRGTARAGLSEVADEGVELLAPAGWETGLDRGGSWVAAQAVLFLWVLGGSLLWGDSMGLPAVLPWVGRLLVLLGALLMLAALRALGSNLTAFPEPLPGATLVTSGLYGLVRHPIYGAVLLLLAGVAVHQASWVGLAGVGGGFWFFWYKSSFEERRLLIAQSGYRHYRAAVPHRFVPFVV